MLLHELEFRDGMPYGKQYWKTVRPDGKVVCVYKLLEINKTLEGGTDEYEIFLDSRELRPDEDEFEGVQLEKYGELDALQAQAILYELLK